MGAGAPPKPLENQWILRFLGTRHVPHFSINLFEEAASRQDTLVQEVGNVSV
jgi:hypothetical protein